MVRALNTASTMAVRTEDLVDQQVCGDTALRPGEPPCRQELFFAGQAPQVTPTAVATARTHAATQAHPAATASGPTNNATSANIAAQAAANASSASGQADEPTRAHQRRSHAAALAGCHAQARRIKFRPDMGATHDVTNQPPPLEGYNVFTSDRVLEESVCREGADWALPKLTKIGDLAGSAEWQALANEANTQTPTLHTHDRFGHRLDEVHFSTAWHRLLAKAVEFGLHGSAWREPRRGAHVARAAGFLVWSQLEQGHGCPVSMTFAAVPVLRRQPELANAWEPKLTAPIYEPWLKPIEQKQGALCGMAMTEKQGGSDVRANTTRADPSGADAYRLTGHKWFCSAPMCDAFLVLAQTPHGLGCFLLPRMLEDGTRNRFFIQRLKDKLGNRSNASSEVEFDGAWARLVGEPGRGVPVIAEMVNATRLDCILGTAALMRQALSQAVHHATYRAAFGKRLIDQPLMTNVLADLALESEAATILAMRLAGASDRAASDEYEAHLRRVGTALGKYWVCKRGPAFVAEALECLGGNGYVEDSGLPRLYREAPLNSIWEGAGNVQALDVLRIISRTPAALDSLVDELALAAGADRRFDAALADVRDQFSPPGPESRARWLAERLPLLLQASLLLRFSAPAMADAFCAARLASEGGSAFGTLPHALDQMAMLARAWHGPKV
jgi:putative acyl-CoA dehydrogenase